jgi:hypothetical protein
VPVSRATMRAIVAEAEQLDFNVFCATENIQSTQERESGVDAYIKFWLEGNTYHVRDRSSSKSAKLRATSLNCSAILL